MSSSRSGWELENRMVRFSVVSDETCCAEEEAVDMMREDTAWLSKT